ncbi:hypothetical protein HY045_01585 [Candidatus Woesebacteria bacterium]|nr:hypothetical protein [Candidatus Woesebacteria bacterium]
MTCEAVFVSATGPDGAGKDTAWRVVRDLLPKDLKIVKIGKPSSVVTDGQEQFVQIGISRSLDKLHERADRTRNHRFITMANFLYVMFQWRLQEPYWTKRIKPDLVFSLRDGYVDPSAYAPFYASDSLGKIGIPGRIAFLRSLHGSPFRNYTLFLDIMPQIAVERIKLRIEGEKKLKADIKRPKWQHEHENLEGLTRIRGEYYLVLKYIEEYCMTKVQKFDVSKTSKLDAGLFFRDFILMAVDS